MADSKAMETAYFGGGCFWCIEAVFRDRPGVDEVVSGYAGGGTRDPSYEEVCTGTTGHAETVKIVFDPALVSYESLLELFFKAHDPTTPNRQGADVGTQYRSVIFYTSDAQRRTAEKAIREASAAYRRQAVTELKPFREFFKAEEYHQDYFRKNPGQGYCAVVIRPKLQKLGIIP
ncbi:MAG: peptide-methionine (S)-S-oxide reductase MsrA [Spirochaetales bacterium]|nr:peptide-methionine (S)-S-oxide reductase MsrA [Spirochaetales bacterium]